MVSKHEVDSLEPWSWDKALKPLAQGERTLETTGAQAQEEAAQPIARPPDANNIRQSRRLKEKALAAEVAAAVAEDSVVDQDIQDALTPPTKLAPEPTLPEVLSNGETEPEAPRTQECEVCGETYPTEDFPHLDGCTCPPTVCRHCFESWLDSQVGSAVTLKSIRCPCSSTKCPTKFTRETVKQYGDDDTFTRYDRIQLQELLRNEENFRYCIAPNCISGQIHNPALGNIFIYGEASRL